MTSWFAKKDIYFNLMRVAKNIVIFKWLLTSCCNDFVKRTWTQLDVSTFNLHLNVCSFLSFLFGMIEKVFSTLIQLWILFTSKHTLIHTHTQAHTHTHLHKHMLIHARTHTHTHTNTDRVKYENWIKGVPTYKILFSTDHRKVQESFVIRRILCA